MESKTKTIKLQDCLRKMYKYLDEEVYWLFTNFTTLKEGKFVGIYISTTLKWTR